METKDVKPLFEDILAKLEIARQKEEDIYASSFREDNEEMPHAMIALGSESGLAKAIVIVKDKLKALEDKRRKRQ